MGMLALQGILAVIIASLGQRCVVVASEAPAVQASSDTCEVDDHPGWKEQYDLFAKFSPGGLVPPLLVKNSSIHGRGLFTPVAVAKGATVSFLWFDYEEHPGLAPETSPADASSDASRAVAGGDFLHQAGYIPAGGDLRVEPSMDAAEAKRLCALNDVCIGITFPNATGELTGTFLVNFKDKGDVSTAAAPGWSSWLKPEQPQVRAVMFPLTCSGDFFPHVLPDDVPPIGLLTCSTRLINHECGASCAAVAEVSLRSLLLSPAGNVMSIS
jgi:hypothetical protein